MYFSVLVVYEYDLKAQTRTDALVEKILMNLICRTEFPKTYENYSEHEKTKNIIRSLKKTFIILILLYYYVLFRATALAMAAMNTIILDER